MNLFKRLMGGIVILFVLLLITFLGRTYLSIGIALFSAMAVKELRDAFLKLGYNTPLLLTIVLNFMIMFDAYINEREYSVISMVLLLMITFIYMIFNKKYDLIDFLPMFFILAYVSILMSHIIKIQDTSYVFMLYIIAWGSDTFAYLVGSKFGRHKFSSVSHISPNKTVEGSIGGIIGAVILVVIYKYIVGIDNNLYVVIIFTIISAILSQIGDLIASFIKRKSTVKDFGNLIPGHGGILDRFDSMLFVSPILYLLSII